jgi:hypothetical protein
MVSETLIALAALATIGATAFGIYEYGQNGSSSSSNTASLSPAVNAEQTNPQSPPYLYDPLINLLPTQWDVAQHRLAQAVNGGTSGVNSYAAAQNGVTNGVVSSASLTRNAAVQNFITSLPAVDVSTGLASYSGNPNTAVNEAQANITSLVQAVGPITTEEYNQLSYSSGTSGVSTLPVYNTAGQITGATVLNNAVANQTNLNVITSNPTAATNANSGTFYSAGAVTAAPNTVIGYTPGTSNAVYSIGSSYQGPGTYELPGGGQTYLSSAPSASMQQDLGLGSYAASYVAPNASSSNAVTVSTNSATPAISKVPSTTITVSSSGVSGPVTSSGSNQALINSVGTAASKAAVSLTTTTSTVPTTTIKVTPTTPSSSVGVPKTTTSIPVTTTVPNTNYVKNVTNTSITSILGLKI